MAAEYTTSKALAYGVLLQSLYSRLLIAKRPDRWKFFADPREISGGRTRTSIILERSMIFSDDRVSIYYLVAREKEVDDKILSCLSSLPTSSSVASYLFP